ncbi:hypothetical protein SLEP1_g20849 [Rubroshorea leprosula]|uniref:Synaptonemal complex protein 1 n=1 Tax=Rubroshorea leprosula TaxID=152421 RepID=A0AAV5JA40_9ROSI|nr:hypothetical protein SLEP1_g20849 [Rubroshorea leprosula]
MKKIGFSSMRSLDQLKSLTGSVAGGGVAKNLSFSSRPSSDSISYGSFANLKLTAEKLVKEQASVKTDLEMANSKLKKSMEHIRVLEEKLQNAFNENAKLKVKQKEDEKLWKGLESKFSSTKALCDQLTDTLQHLAGQVQDAEKDKEFFEVKLSASSKAIDCLNQKMDALSLKLVSAEENIRGREKELEELKIGKEEREKFYRDEQCRTVNLIEEKDAMIKKFEATVAANKQAAASLNSKLREVHLELSSKEVEITRLVNTKENLEKEKSNLQLSNGDFARKLAMSIQETKNLEGCVHVLAAQLVELDKQNLTFTDKFDELNSLYDACFKLVQQERDLAAKHSQKLYDQLHGEFLCIASERDALQLVNKELNDKITELQRVQESVMAQLSEESRLAGERIKRLESESENLLSKKTETEKLVSELEQKVNFLSESSRSSENKVQDLLFKISALELEKKDYTEQMLTEIQRKTEEMDSLQKESQKRDLCVDSLEKQVSHVQNILGEKEQLIMQYEQREKRLQDQITQNQEMLVAAESKIEDAKKQYDLMLESKQSELSRHLKEISQRNDQAINDIRRKYEVEKQEIVSQEKEKAAKLIGEMETTCEQKLADFKEESRLHLMHIQEEHAVLESPFQGVTQRPVSKLLKKVQNAKTGSIMSTPKHHKKVTHHEYEVETTNGRTITKRRKTRSTVMFEDPSKQKKMNAAKAIVPGSFVKEFKGGHRNPSSNIGDLFSEGSLNPYADDPYAFD